MNHDITVGRQLKNRRRNIASGAPVMERFTSGEGATAAGNAADMARMSASTATMQADMNAMQVSEDAVVNMVSSLGRAQQYGQKNVKGRSQIQEVPSYVTRGGILKPFDDRQAFQDTRGQNNCPKDVEVLDAEGDAGTGYGTFPVGSAMVTGQSCGDEGQFAQVTKFDASATPDDVAGSLGQLGYIDADANMRPISRGDYLMSDQYTTTTTSLQGSNMVSCDPNYTALESLGCWVDESDRAISGVDNGFKVLGSKTGVASIQKCADYCKTLGSTIFSLQAGKQCFCAADAEGYQKYGPSDNCTTPCMGNEEETCGGTWANQVYKNNQEPPSCDVDMLKSTCTSDDDCIGFAVNPNLKTYQTFGTGLKGTDLMTTSTNDKTFYTRNASFATTDASCSGSVVNRDMDAGRFRNYPVKSAMAPDGTDQCGLGQFLQPELDQQDADAAAVNDQAAQMASSNVSAAQTTDSIRQQSMMDNVNAADNINDFVSTTSGTVNAMNALQDITWKQDAGNMSITKRQGMYKTVIWTGVAIAALGIAVKVGKD